MPADDSSGAPPSGPLPACRPGSLPCSQAGLVQQFCVGSQRLARPSARRPPAGPAASHSLACPPHAQSWGRLAAATTRRPRCTTRATALWPRVGPLGAGPVCGQGGRAAAQAGLGLGAHTLAVVGHPPAACPAPMRDLPEFSLPAQPRAQTTAATTRRARGGPSGPSPRSPRTCCSGPTRSRACPRAWRATAAAGPAAAGCAGAAAAARAATAARWMTAPPSSRWTWRAKRWVPTPAGRAGRARGRCRAWLQKVLGWAASAAGPCVLVPTLWSQVCQVAPVDAQAPHCKPPACPPPPSGPGRPSRYRRGRASAACL